MTAATDGRPSESEGAPGAGPHVLVTALQETVVGRGADLGTIADMLPDYAVMLLDEPVPDEVAWHLPRRVALIYPRDVT